jgi:hypothetical protein
MAQFTHLLRTQYSLGRVLPLSTLKLQCQPQARAESVITQF